MCLLTSEAAIKGAGVQQEALSGEPVLICIPDLSIFPKCISPQSTLNSDCTNKLYFSGKNLIIKRYFWEKCYHQKTPIAFLPSKIKSLKPLEAHSWRGCNSFFNITHTVLKTAQHIDQGMARVFWPRCQEAVRLRVQ